MKRLRLLSLATFATIALFFVPSPAQEAPVDFEKAGQIMARARNGEIVSAADRAYIERAKQAKPPPPAGKKRRARHRRSGRNLSRRYPSSAPRPTKLRMVDSTVAAATPRPPLTSPPRWVRP